MGQCHTSTSKIDKVVFHPECSPKCHGELESPSDLSSTGATRLPSSDSIPGSILIEGDKPPAAPAAPLPPLSIHGSTYVERKKHGVGKTCRYALESLMSSFPQAYKAEDVARRAKRMLVNRYGFTDDNTVYGESTCPDEINHTEQSLGHFLSEDWGERFQMGGIGGCPFVGKAGFDALLSHAPDNGNVLIMFGPHVGISPEGQVGKYVRAGQQRCSTACGAAIAAFEAGMTGDMADQGDKDIEQSFLKQAIGKQAHAISKAEVPMAELAYRTYQVVEGMMMELMHGIGKSCSSTSFKQIVLLGGIQINMPSPHHEHFLPLKFIMASRKDSESTMELTDLFPAFSLMELDEQAIGVSLNRYFAGFRTNADMVRFSQAILQVRYGFSRLNTLYGQSLCADEVNHARGELGDLMRRSWGKVFNLGGIGGIPFVGKTGFGAFSAHVPDNGNLLILYGPHVGLSPTGEIGKLLRTGQHHLTRTCPTAIAAYESGLFCSQSCSDDPNSHDMMTHLKRIVSPKSKSISQSEEPMATLAKQMFQISDSMLCEITNHDFGHGWLALLGGIQINLPPPLAGVFLPLKFTISRKGECEVDLMPDLINQFDIHQTDEVEVLQRRPE